MLFFAQAVITAVRTAVVDGFEGSDDCHFAFKLGNGREVGLAQVLTRPSKAAVGLGGGISIG